MDPQLGLFLDDRTSLPCYNGTVQRVKPALSFTDSQQISAYQIRESIATATIPVSCLVLFVLLNLDGI